jgi:hypothetical protein
MQGLPLPNSIGFEELLFFISSLAMKGSFFFGELHIPSDWIITVSMLISLNCSKSLFLTIDVFFSLW